MKLLTLDTFIEMFHQNKTMTFPEYLDKAKVRIGDHLEPLKEYMKRKDIEKAKIKLLFENIQNRNEYLKRFYNMSLRVQDSNLHIEDVAMKNKAMDNNKHPTYKNLIRNLHYKDILENTKSGIDNVPTYMEVITDLYLHNIIDYKILTPSALFYIRDGRLGSVFSSFYFRASIMNPFLVYSLNHSVLKGTKIFTPTLGWTSYCFGYGFLGSLRSRGYHLNLVALQTMKFLQPYQVLEFLVNLL
jgi:hypothetical protein